MEHRSLPYRKHTFLVFTGSSQPKQLGQNDGGLVWSVRLYVDVACRLRQPRRPAGHVGWVDIYQLSCWIFSTDWSIVSLMLAGTPLSGLWSVRLTLIPLLCSSVALLVCVCRVRIIYFSLVLCKLLWNNNSLKLYCRVLYIWPCILLVANDLQFSKYEIFESKLFIHLRIGPQLEVEYLREDIFRV